MREERRRVRRRRWRRGRCTMVVGYDLEVGLEAEERMAKAWEIGVETL